MSTIHQILLGTSFVLGVVGVIQPNWRTAALGVMLLAIVGFLK